MNAKTELMTMKGIITEDSKPNKYQKLNTEILKGLLNKRNRQLGKIKKKISFESRYENYNQLTSPLEAKKEKKIDQIRQIKNVLKERGNEK